MSKYKHINHEELMSNFEGLEDILEVTIAEYQELEKKMLDDLALAIEKNSAKDIELYAHSLKGAVSNFRCEEIRLMTLSIEKMGNENNTANAKESFENLKNLLSELKLELSSLEIEIKAS